MCRSSPRRCRRRLRRLLALATDDGHWTTLVKSQIGVEIRRNSNSLLSFYNDYVPIELGFVCRILAVFALRARVIAELDRGAVVAEKRRVLGAAVTATLCGWKREALTPALA